LPLKLWNCDEEFCLKLVDHVVNLNKIIPRMIIINAAIVGTNYDQFHRCPSFSIKCCFVVEIISLQQYHSSIYKNNHILISY
jgi:hypothetical protein